MPSASQPYDKWLSRESLPLKRIVNKARGAPMTDWSLCPFWKGIVGDLFHAIHRGELPAGPHSIERFQTVGLHELWVFLAGRNDRWQPLRDFCKRWAAVRGEILADPADISAGPQKSTAADGQDTEADSAPGRPDHPAQSDHEKSEPAPKRRGRPKGAGSYEAADEQLIKEMRRLKETGAAQSDWDAAQQVAPQAKGGGSQEARAKRLLLRFQNNSEK